MEHNLDGWFPVKKDFVWLHGFTPPVGSLPRVQSLRTRDAVIHFTDKQLSARVQIAIFPRTPDATISLVDPRPYTLAGLTPHYIVRVSVDGHPPTDPTVIVRKKFVVGAETGTNG